MDPILLTLEKISKILESISNKLDVLVKKSKHKETPSKQRLDEEEEKTGFDKFTLDLIDLRADVKKSKLVEDAMQQYNRIMNHEAQHDVKKSKDEHAWNPLDHGHVKKSKPCDICGETLYHKETCPKSVTEKNMSVPPRDIEYWKKRWEEEELDVKKSNDREFCSTCDVWTDHNYQNCPNVKKSNPPVCGWCGNDAYGHDINHCAEIYGTHSTDWMD